MFWELNKKCVVIQSDSLNEQKLDYLFKTELLNKEYSDYINFNKIFIDSCALGRLNCVKILIERGLIETINKDICLKNGLEYACFHGHIDIVELILSRFILKTKILNNGLEYACERGHIQIAKLMMEHGACDCEHGLERACMGGHIDCVNLMIAQGIYKDFIGECMKTLEIYDSDPDQYILDILDTLVFNSDSITYHDTHYREYKTKQLLKHSKLHEYLATYVISKII